MFTLKVKLHAHSNIFFHWTIYKQTGDFVNIKLRLRSFADSVE